MSLAARADFIAIRVLQISEQLQMVATTEKYIHIFPFQVCPFWHRFSLALSLSYAYFETK